MHSTTATAIPVLETHRVATSKIVRHLTTTARLLLGLPLLVFGLNGFLNFIPPPSTPMPQGAMEFVGALVNSGYMMPLIAATLLIVGALLVSNRFVPLALVIFAPFMVNSVGFHLALERSGLVMALIFVGLQLFLAWRYRGAYRSLLTSRSVPQ